jgi:type VII secretion integral membrane protein EccD
MPVGVELCRLTVRSPQRRCDLAMPSSATVGELIPLLLRLTVPEATGPEPVALPAPWVLHRLGGPPFDPGDTAEKLDLREGEILYLDPAETAPPELNFDDIGVGVAEAVQARADFWRPAFTRVALVAASTVAMAGYAAAVAGLRPAADRPLWLCAAAAVLTTAAVLNGRVLRDRALALVCGLAACVFAAAAGAVAHQGAAGPVIDHRTLALAGGGAVLAGSLCLCVGRLPVTLFGGVTGVAACGVLGAAAVAELHCSDVQAAAALAVALFAVTAHAMRIALRAARLRVSQLPHTAEELQQDITPDTAATVTRRATTLVQYLNALFISLGAVWLAAVALLARDQGWTSRGLAVALCIAVLLRSHSVSTAWQRGPLAACAVLGLVWTAIAWVAQIGPGPRAVVLVALAATAAGLLTAARRLPGRRLLPLWGQLADRLELCSAVVLIPLLLQLFHTYSYFRALIG